MEQNHFFDWFVKYHCERNMAECAPYVNDGIIYSPANKGRQIQEGREIKEYQGILVFKNGNTLLNRLVSDKLVNPKHISAPAHIGSLDELFSFMDNREDQDGVYVYESANKDIVRVSKVRDVVESKPLITKVPLDFVFYNGIPPGMDAEKVLGQWIGCKTRLAIDITDRYQDVQAYQIKASGYTPLGMGKVTHFDKDGLRKEFFLKYEAGNICGIRRDYSGQSRGEHKDVVIPQYHSLKVA